MLRKIRPQPEFEIYQPICNDAIKLIEENEKEVKALQSQVKTISDVKEREWQ
jgi:hypothetical protein